jgi:uncharacterized damage-inducible protein DinB
MTVEPTYLISGFSGNAWVIGRLTEDFTHADSLLVPAYGGNCLNWVLGHVLISRHRVLHLLALDPLWTAEKIDLYETGSEPIEGRRALSFEGLMADLAGTTEQITGGLGEKSFADMARELPKKSEGQDPQTVGQALLGLYWHESYHIGQMELLRRVAGKMEKVFG